MYELNPNLARKADTFNKFIQETGKYTGTFIRAEKLVSASKGTDGIGFTFKDDAGNECRFDIWTRKQNGEELSGLNQINAIMTCLGLRSLPVSQVRVKKWENGAEIMVNAPCFADLMNKKIGLLLRSEEYEKMKDGRPTGESGWKIGLFAAYQAGTELMASEILDRKTSPEQLEKAIRALADKPLKKSAKPAHSASNTDHQAGRFDDLEDDIPF